MTCLEIKRIQQPDELRYPVQPALHLFGNQQDAGILQTAARQYQISESLQFIIPLRRDNSLIDYDAIKSNTFKDGANYFEHEKREIWYKKYDAGDHLYLHLFLDDQLRVKDQDTSEEIFHKGLS